MKLLIVRHADPDYENDTITPKGEKQAEALAERLKNCPIDHIYVSPCGRAKKTAKFTIEALKVEPAELDWLTELRIEGCPWSSPHNDYLKKGEFGSVLEWEKDYFAGPGTLRSFKEVAQGLDDLLAEHHYFGENNLYRVEKHSEEVLALFTHAAATLAILSHLLHWHLPLAFAHLEVSHTALSEVLFEESKEEAIPRLKTFNDISHLGDFIAKSA